MPLKERFRPPSTSDERAIEASGSELTAMFQAHPIFMLTVVRALAARRIADTEANRSALIDAFARKLYVARGGVVPT